MLFCHKILILIVISKIKLYSQILKKYFYFFRKQFVAKLQILQDFLSESQDLYNQDVYRFLKIATYYLKIIFFFCIFLT